MVNNLVNVLMGNQYCSGPGWLGLVLQCSNWAGINYLIIPHIIVQATQASVDV